MVKEIDPVSKYMKRLSGFDVNKIMSLSVEELDKHITQAESLFEHFQRKNAEHPRLSELQDILLLLRQARGKGEVM